MKSAFASPETKTYEYPGPLDKPLDPQMAKESRKKIDHEVWDEVKQHAKDHPGAPLLWVKIRIPHSKGEVDQIADYSQSMVSFGENGDGTTMKQRIAHANRGIFDLLVEGWWLSEEVSGENYAKLAKWSGDWIAACIADAVARGTQPDFPEPTPTSSRRR